MSFIPIAPHGQSVPVTVEKTLASGAAHEKGALMLVNGSGEFAECGADPTAIAGVSVSAGGTDSSGFNILGRKEFPANKMQCYWVGGNQRFKAKYVGTVGTVGAQYGVIRDTDGQWKVDFNEVTTKSVTFHKSNNVAPENEPTVEVSFVPSFVTPL